MSGKISNNNESSDGSMKVMDIDQDKSDIGSEYIDNKLNSGLKDEMKLANGIVKEDFENSITNSEKETVVIHPINTIEKTCEEVKLKNGFNSVSENITDILELPSDDTTKDPTESNGLNIQTSNEIKDTSNVELNNTEKSCKNEEKAINGLELLKPNIDIKNEVSTEITPKTDSTPSNDIKVDTVEIINKDTKIESTPKIEIDQNKSEKNNTVTKDEDENNDVIIIGTSEGVAKSTKENYDSSQKIETRNAMVKQVKSQTGSTSVTKTESSVSMSSSSSTSTPSLGDTSMTAFARLLHDLGVELVRQHVYKDLVEIQVSKDAQNKLNEREKEQLAKLEEFYAKQEIRNAPYNLKEYTVRCKCRVFASESKNVMRLHQEYGRIESGSVHVCCCCKEFKSRWPSHYITHMKTDHDMVGRLRKKMSPYRCSFCSYEAKNQLKIDTHMITCSKRFVLACNLQPLPADTDIPLKRRFIQTISYTSSQNRYSNYLNSNNTGYTSIYNQNGPSYNSFNQNNRVTSDASNRSIYNNMNNSSNSILSHQQQQAAKDARASSAKMEVCEICGSNIFSRAALLNHLQIMHKVKLSAARGSTEPVMSCDRCSARFWTYQGLAKHATMVHKSSTSSSLLSNSSHSNSQSGMHANMNRVPPVCHICGDSQTFNPLNHMSTRHNITLLDMYQVKQCYICNKALKNGPNFQEHMVLYHRDIFANKDVLHTVLQALSAARHLKREESSQLPSPSNFNKFKKSNHQLTSTPISSHKSGMYVSSALGGGMKSTPVKRRLSQTTPPSSAKVPEKEKKTTEQERAEMDKLYENLAGIGRPILRSMKSRMSTGPSPKTTPSNNNNTPSNNNNTPSNNNNTPSNNNNTPSNNNNTPNNNNTSTNNSTTQSTSASISNNSSNLPSTSNTSLKKLDSFKSDNNNNNSNNITKNTTASNNTNKNYQLNSPNQAINNNNTNFKNFSNNNNNSANAKQINVNSLKSDSGQCRDDSRTQTLCSPVESESKRMKVDESVVICDSN